MKLLFIGDTHNTLNLNKVDVFLAQAGLTANDALIHCGDWGAAWNGAEDEALRYWRMLPMKVLVCLGNHENYGWIQAQPLIRRWGCLGYDLGGRVFAPLPGQILRMGGKRLWFYPGGLSIDFYLRTPQKNLFKEELLTPSDSEGALARLFSGKQVDFVVSHDGPRDWVMSRFGFPLKHPPESYYQHLKTENGSRVHPAFALNQVYARPHMYRKWYFGHHHKDAADDQIRCLWDLAALVDTKTGQETLLSV